MCELTAGRFPSGPGVDVTGYLNDAPDKLNNFSFRPQFYQ